MVRPVELNGIWYTNKRYFSVFFCSRFTIVANGLAAKTATPNEKHFHIMDTECWTMMKLHVFAVYFSSVTWVPRRTRSLSQLKYTSFRSLRSPDWRSGFRSIRLLTLDLSSEWPQGIPFIFVILCASICRAVQTLMRMETSLSSSTCNANSNRNPFFLFFCSLHLSTIDWNRLANKNINSQTIDDDDPSSRPSLPTAIQSIITNESMPMNAVAVEMILYSIAL